jgi:hypothetical protein
MFTHGVSLDWLRSRAPGIEDHLCISDGTAVRPIPTMRNHLFLYRLGSVDNAAAFARLSRCAPELLAGFHSQLNTSFGFRVGRDTVVPPTVLLQGTAKAKPSSSFKFYAHVDDPSLEASVQNILQTEVSFKAKSGRFSHLTYVPMTEAAAHDKPFAKKIAQAIRRSYADPARSVVLRLPRLNPSARIEQRLEAALRAVRAPDLDHPRVPQSSVLFVTEDPTAQALTALAAARDLLVHSSLEFWHHPAGYYAGFHMLQIVGSMASVSERRRVSELLNSALGRSQSRSEHTPAGTRQWR